MIVKREPTGTPGITKITYASGEVRYRLVLDAGPDPATGKRRQLCSTHRRLKDAQAERSRILHERDTGSLVLAERLTVKQACEEWLAGRRGIADNSAKSYRQAVDAIAACMGATPVQALTKALVDDMVTGMESGRLRRSGHGPLSPGTVRLTVGVLSQVLTGLVKQGRLARNVAALVELPPMPKRRDRGLTLDEAQRFAAAARRDRYAALWELSMRGLRRMEAVDVCWSAVGLDSRTLQVTDAKTPSGVRELPFDQDEALAQALRAHKRMLAEERLRAGEGYTPTDRLAVDELGAPITGGQYYSRFKLLARQAGLPAAATLHSLRHASVTLMRLAGVHPEVIAKWHGHATGAFTMSVYVDEPRQAALSVAGKALADLLTDPSCETRVENEG